MPALRLLYCDSAGVRRCRVVVTRAPAPLHAGASCSTAEAQLSGLNLGTTAAGSNGQPQAGGGLGLEVTPSMLLAAGAGAVPTPAAGAVPAASAALPSRQSLQPSASLKTVGEDRVLSPEASELEQQQQPDPQAAAEAATGSSGGRPGLRPSPSMLLAAAVGAVPGSGDGPAFRLAGSSESSREASPQRGATVGGGEVQRAARLAAASAAGASALAPRQPDASFTGSSGGSVAGLQQSPSMVWAAGAGLLPAGPPTSGNENGSSAPGASYAPASPLRPPQLQQQGSGSLADGARCSTPPLPSRLPGSRPKTPSAFALSPQASAVAVSDLSAAVERSVGLTKACMAHPAFADIVAVGSGLSVVGEVLLVPDLAAAVAIPWCPGSSMAPADMLEKDLSQPWPCCPRSALKRALTRLEVMHGLTLMAGFELEFVLLKPAPTEARVDPEAAGSGVLLGGGRAWVPFDTSVYDQTSSIDAAMPVMADIVETLQALGIGVLQFHAESAPGQFEVALTHFPALEAADKLMYAREAVTSVVQRHGLAVTFLPKPFPGAAGSGCHMHFSLLRGGCNIMVDAGMDAAAGLPPGCYPLSSEAGSFLAGVLHHLPGLLPFTLPSVNSYERLQPSCWSGAYLCWGYENREAPLRVCCPHGGPQRTNAEFKASDGTNNPYIALAAVLAGGMQGLEEGSRLPEPLQVDPAAPGNEAVTQKLQQLPSSLAGALQALGEDASLQAVLKEVLGDELLTAYLAVRRCEEAHSPSITDMLLRY